MPFSFCLRTSLLSLALLTLLATPVLADPPGHEGWRGPGPMEDRGPPRHEEGPARGRNRSPAFAAREAPRFDDTRREQVFGYMRETHRGDCPPGLMKKHNRCRPPGHSRKYRVGGYLPRGYHPVPPPLMERLGPPPEGASYAMVDNDVLLVTTATKKILDAVTILSAIQ